MNGDPDPLAAVRARFLERCRDDLAVLDAALATGSETRPEIAERVHKLAGAAGTFGFAAISNLALNIDDDVRDGHPMDRQALAELAEAVRRIL